MALADAFHTNGLGSALDVVRYSSMAWINSTPLRKLPPPHPTLNKVQPRRAGRREVQHEPWVFFQPSLYLGLVVGPIVVHDQMQRRLFGEFPVQLPQEAQELLVPVLGHAFPDHPSVQDVEGRKQGGGPMALVVVGHGSAAPFLHRQPWLSPLP